MHLLVTSLAWILSTASAIPTIRSSSKCSVQSCNGYSLLNCVSNEDGCFNFQTNNGTNFCAPATSCELLDPCDHSGICTTNRSVCIINSCCAQPVCLPLILVDLCSPNNVSKERMNFYTTASGLSTAAVLTSTESQSSISTTTIESTTDSSTTETSSRSITSTEVSSSTEFQYKERRLQKFEPSLSPSSPIFHPKICPKASWNITGTTVVSFSDLTPGDFFLNQYDEIYLPDRKNHLIRKYLPGNDSRWLTAVESDLLIDPTAIFVDLNDNIYIWDSKSYRVYLWSSVERNIRIILSFDGCKQSADLNEICFGKSLFVDSNYSIYISESSERYSHTNRVMKFEVNSTIGHVIAGISTFGSGMKQLHSPETIFVDSKGILYVADTGNSRIQQFVPGDRNGTTVMSLEGLTDFIMDQDGGFYVTVKSENVVKKLMKKNSKNLLEYLHQPTKIRFGIDGSIYVMNEGDGIIKKFQIINNICSNYDH